MSKKTRYFSLITYANEKQIQKILGKHIKSIRACSYIYHDVDEAEPHHHILIRTHATWTSKQIARWFELLKDKNKEYINTFCEVANDMEAMKVYILHADKESRLAGKHLYSPEDIKDFGYCDLSEKKNGYDSSYEILNRVLMGANPRDLVRFYGRDFLYHMSQYYDCADKIRELEGYKEALTFARLEHYDEKKLIPCDDLEDS